MHPLVTESQIAEALRALPAEQTPPFDFAALRQRRARALELHAARRALLRSWSVFPRAAVPVAAALSLLLAGVALWSRSMSERAAHAPTPAVHLLAASTTPPAAIVAWLSDASDDRAIVRVSTRLAVTDLEDRIAAMDDALNAERIEGAGTARVRDLQRTREHLVTSLAQVRYAELLVADTP